AKKAFVESIRLVPGFFEQTMPGKLPAKIAFLHIDCDLYEPVLHVLTHCIGRLAAGGIVIFDEYHDQKWPGAKKAADAFCAEHGLSIVFFPELQRYGIRIKG
ncbi:MAG TPA: TylF/MycF/NovP-related O-methyltransferase, partial [Cytophagales bacterium]